MCQPKSVIQAFTLILFVACSKSPMEDPAMTVTNQAATKGQEASCICTKEYNPVCSKSGRTYPSPCQAKCDGVEDYTMGACKASN